MPLSRPVVGRASGSGYRLLAREEVMHPNDPAIADGVHDVDLAAEWCPRPLPEARACQADHDLVARVDHLQVIDAEVVAGKPVAHVREDLIAVVAHQLG